MNSEHTEPRGSSTDESLSLPLCLLHILHFILQHKTQLLKSLYSVTRFEKIATTVNFF